GAEAERQHAQGPPQQVRRPLGEIMRHDAAKKEDREERGENWYVTDHVRSPLNVGARMPFYTSVTAQSNERREGCFHRPDNACFEIRLKKKSLRPHRPPGWR